MTAEETPPTATDVEKRRQEAARRALAEAAERETQRTNGELPKEVGANRAVEPTRYGDWEKKGIASDF